MSVRLFAQPGSRQDQFPVYRDSLKHLGLKMVNHPEELERKNANYNFIRTLISTLKLPGSYQFQFDSVKAITTVNSPDQRFRIFTWHVMNDDGSYRFYGAIQMNTGKGGLKLYPLGDYSPFMKNPQDTVTDNGKWYGAQYYQVIPVGETNPYYVLLGWKGYTPKSTKKVIEVLSFPDNSGKLVFGAPVFIDKGPVKNRVVFQYTRQASMLLKYDPTSRLIVFDHLAPPDKRLKDQPDTYGPDLTYDAYRLRNGKWQFEENVDMRNAASATDEQYIDPKKKP
ncbi:hypothetical protein MUY27_09430 [Mucilaginibacter sp. RS28]|uniref:Uncharacterized protein n=1 Tax=Mucilaginibacter straminoryzae TaxID=2932774 RepID=A0A9X1X3Z2_9SPHI|nr:hypothetical protein [Mucilaginibacter straminoryzae]MCJ8209930.1 hypothetical protein [Mucilaginibacter straminoryzae]